MSFRDLGIEKKNPNEQNSNRFCNKKIIDKSICLGILKQKNKKNKGKEDVKMKYLIHIVTTDLYTSVKNRFMLIRCAQSMRSPEKYI